MKRNRSLMIGGNCVYLVLVTHRNRAIDGHVSESSRLCFGFPKSITDAICNMLQGYTDSDGGPCVDRDPDVDGHLESVCSSACLSAMAADLPALSATQTVITHNAFPLTEPLARTQNSYFFLLGGLFVMRHPRLRGADSVPANFLGHVPTRRSELSLLMVGAN